MGHRSFSLIELVVVIAVVLLLAGITLSVSVAVVEHAELRRTEMTMRLLETAVREWELAADRKLSWWNYDDDPTLRDLADVHGTTLEVLIITEILGVITRSEGTRAIVAQIAPDLLFTYRSGDSPPWIYGEIPPKFDGTLTVLDAWGKPIYATHPGRPWQQEDELDDRDPDGTLRTFNETRYGVAPNRQVVFVSAGPDGLFGLPEEFPGFGVQNMEARSNARLDNLYSTPVTFSGY